MKKLFRILNKLTATDIWQSLKSATLVALLLIVFVGSVYHIGQDELSKQKDNYRDSIQKCLFKEVEYLKNQNNMVLDMLISTQLQRDSNSVIIKRVMILP